jgi:hypothetical protein
MQAYTRAPCEVPLLRCHAVTALLLHCCYTVADLDGGANAGGDANSVDHGDVMIAVLVVVVGLSQWC